MLIVRMKQTIYFIVHVFRSDPQSLEVPTYDTQVVPVSGKEVVFSDCVVPISKLTLNDQDLTDLHYDLSVDSFSLNSHFVNSEVTLASSDQISLASHSCSIADSSVTQTVLQLSETTSVESPPYFRRTEPNTVLQSRSQRILDDQVRFVSNSPRHARSTEELNIHSHSSIPDATAVSQRVRRNSSGLECRMRRHSAAPFRTIGLNSHHRRRSHDVRDEQADLLERLHVAATRRRSLSSPFQSSARSQCTHKQLPFRN